MRGKSMLTKSLWCLLCLLPIAVCPAATGKIIYVDDDGPADFSTIQAAIDDANNGDTVFVAPGIYTGDGNRDIDFKGKAITVRSTDPNDLEIVKETVINCQGSEEEPHRGFQFISGEGRDSILAGFKIINGFGPAIGPNPWNRPVGGAILCLDSGPTIYGCILVRNAARQEGGGICCINADVAITSCTIEQNTVGSCGGGIFCEGGSVVIDQCSFRSNVAEYGGGIYFRGCIGSIRDCLISNNLAQSCGGGVLCYEKVDVVLNNCTVVQNLVFDGQKAAGGVEPYPWHTDTSIILTNCILWSNRNGDRCDLSTQTNTELVNLSHCCVQGGTPELAGVGNFGDDPLLTPDFHLQADSACIDAGDPNTSLALLSTDIDGELRSTGGQVDIGCDEYIDLDNDTLPDFWERKHFGTISNTEGGQNPDDDQWTNIQEYNRGSNPIYPPGTFYVNAFNGDDDWDGLSAVWDGQHGPKATIQAAINQASVSDGDCIILAPGTYTGQGNCDIDFKGKSISVESTDPNDPALVALTVVDCMGREGDPHRGFIFNSGETYDSILRGISIVGGKVADKGGAIKCDIGSSPKIVNCNISRNESSGYGGGIYCGSYCNPLILECLIEGNTAESGAGINSYEFSSPKIQKCIIQDNTASKSGGAINAAASGFRQQGPIVIDCEINNNQAKMGGAIYCGRPSIMVSNCILNGNTATESGGAIFCFQSAPSFTNCTIVNNHAEISGGAFSGAGGSSSGGVLFENCIIWDNSASVGDAISRLECGCVAGCPSVKIIHCCLPIDNNALAPGAQYGWYVDFEKSVFSLNPRFENPHNGDFRLRSDSPCIDAGNNNPTRTLPSTDINETSRIVDGDNDGVAVIDLGAHETKIPNQPALRPSVWICEFVSYQDTLTQESQQVTIKNIGTGAISWQAVSDAQWLKVSPDNGYMTDGQIDVTLQVDASGLSIGIYEEEVVFFDSNSPESQTYISVILNTADTFTVPDQSPTIQAAIDSATVPGTRIILKDGTYKGAGNRDITFRGIPVSLFSENGPTNCIIDCEGSEAEPHRAFVFDQLEDHRTVIEGITIRGAYIRYGTAIDCAYGSPVISNCRIIDSPSGGISCGAGTYPLIENCFIEGVIDCFNANLKIRRCDIIGEIKCEYGHLAVELSSITSDKKAVSLENGDCTIIDSTITGSIYLDECGHVDVNGCTIRSGTWPGNISGDAKYINIQDCLIYDGSHAGVSCTAEQIHINDCTLWSNKGTGIRVSGIQDAFSEEQKDYMASIRNCLITKNGEELRGGGINCSNSNVTIEDCQIIANHGPGIGLYSNYSSTIRNSVICANRTDLRGAGVRCSSHTTIQSCTIALNIPVYEGGAVHGYSSGSSGEPTHIELINCILWENGQRPLILWDQSIAHFYYCNIQDDWPGEGNIDADPCFVELGYWADMNDPNIAVALGTSYRELVDPNVVWIDGDYHLKSQAGRFDPGSASWMVDQVTSPCIDAGDPNMPFSDEPEPNGGRINMGAYGGTLEASKSISTISSRF